MLYESRDWPKSHWPQGLLEIPQPPATLRIRGYDFTGDANLFGPDRKILCVVGPRKYSEYGERACKEIISGLAGYPISIVSGLAFGIDSIAHESALENDMHTICIPGSGLSDNVIYPKSHFNLAMKILESGGCLISEFDDDFEATNWGFPQRNRLMVGISDAVLLLEASNKSGTMITARMATDYNRDLAIVPGSIFSGTSAGANKLLKDGATPVTCAEDVLNLLGIEINEKDLRKNRVTLLGEKEKILYEKISEIHNVSDLQKSLSDTFSISEFNSLLSLLEINDLIHFINGEIYHK
jgi:DNA processing protein